VYFGSAQADPKAVSCTATECHVSTPPGADTVNVRVDVAGQMSLETPADDYTYLGDPTIKTVGPGSGGEGTVITIDGTDFFPAPYQTEVSFGSDAVPAACPTPIQCTVASPPGLGPVEGAVVTPQGRTASFPFTRLPGVTTLAPRNGPVTGYTVVRITGTGFDTRPGRTLVEFGVTPALAVGCSSSTECIAVSPPGSGEALVSATVGGWESLPGDENYFGYTSDEAQATPTGPVDVRFAEDSDALDADDEAFLQAVLDAMQGAPASMLSVEGHADSSGPDDYNDDLALRRAQAVTDWLVAGGLAADRITTVSHGEHMPVASNDTADGRAINRRVTMTITEG
jgi:outer membrane protein OmpA-like peptidoglycan-associated protein